MSRHELTPLDETVSCIAVGWERTFGTFYAQVFLAADDNEYDIPSISLGDDFYEATDPAQVIDVVRPYAQVPANLAITLHADAQAEGSCEPPTLVSIGSGQPVNTDGWPCPF